MDTWIWIPIAVIFSIFFTFLVTYFPTKNAYQCDTRGIRNKGDQKDRLAICVNGHFRDMDAVKAFWSKISKYDNVDIYVHTWDQRGRRSHNWIKDKDDPVTEKSIRSIMKPTKIKIETMNIDDYSISDKITLFKAQNLPGFYRFIGSQLYSWRESFLLIENPYEYKCILRIRADYVLDHFDPDEMLAISDDTKESLNVNCMNHKHYGGGGGCRRCTETKSPCATHSNDICDIFFYGHPAVMSRVMRMYEFTNILIRNFHEHNHTIGAYQNEKEIQPHPTDENVFLCQSSDHWNDTVKCMYPERMIREHMAGTLILDDPLKIIPIKKTGI